MNLLKSVLCILALSCLASCYQIHSDDDLRTIPVTNNPNIVPQNNSRMPVATH
ncbi:MAG: hypothetical protein K2P51_04575 [Rhabdochlamydiaceae bacterium]|nr:hypothetical protein [Rhabdochlamydiaceae bacterium]